MKIIYIGNKLALKGKNPTSIETLGNYLIQEGFKLVRFSDKKNEIFRILHMIYGTITNLNSKYIIIDTYSTNSFWYTVIISQLARLFKIKYILCLRGGNLSARLDKNPKIADIVFNNSYINVAPSGFLKYEFEKRNFKNVILIPNTIEIDNYKFISRSLKTPKILWVRSFADLYNPTLAIDILVKLKEKYPDAELCMVGPEKDGTLEITKQYALNKNVNVTFTGKLEKKEWIKLSENYNIFLNTTNFDNTPVSVMEAMALGLAIVSTNVGGLPYLIDNGNDGYLTNPSDANAMADIIEKLVISPEMYNNVISNARFKAQSWDWHNVKNIWKEILK